MTLRNTQPTNERLPVLTERERDMHHCKVCNYAAKFPSYLARHMLCHSGEKSVVCDVCGQRFRTVSEMNMHRRIHNPIELTCNTCGFKCQLKKVMDRHILVHIEAKPFQCPHCSYRCRRRMDLKKHIAGIEPVIVESEYHLLKH